MKAPPHPGTSSTPKHSSKRAEPQGPPATHETPCYRAKMLPSQVMKHKSFCQCLLNDCLSQDRHLRNQGFDCFLPLRLSDTASIHLFIPSSQLSPLTRMVQGLFPGCWTTEPVVYSSQLFQVVQEAWLKLYSLSTITTWLAVTHLAVHLPDTGHLSTFG